MDKLRRRMARGSVGFRNFEIEWSCRRRVRPEKVAPAKIPTGLPPGPHRLHIGPGPRWVAPDDSWLTTDVDPARGDLTLNLNELDRLPLPSGSTLAIYASHTFEHVSVFRIQRVLTECHRILAPGGILRIVVPDVVESIRRYLAHDEGFELFERRRERVSQKYGQKYTLFECMREDFISRSMQTDLLGEALAHQNAWDFESLRADLVRAGFDEGRIVERGFREIGSPDFAFEGTYPSEANESYRSLYVEATKQPSTGDTRSGASAGYPKSASSRSTV